jgi:integrase/recombinase XerD
MKQYVQKVELFFELKGTPNSSRESYWRRMWAFLNYMQNIKRPIEELSYDDIQQYILYLKKEKKLSAGTINNYISAIKFFFTYVLENRKRMESIKGSEDEKNSEVPCYSFQRRNTFTYKFN